MRCDVCSQNVGSGRGYILSTSQVVYDPGYWKRALGLLPASSEQLERGLPQLVRQMSSSKSDWIVCQECMNSLKAERSKSSRHFKKYAKKGTRPRLPDSGPADIERAAIVARGAFEALFGRPPHSIQLEDSPDQVVDSVEFSQKMAEVLRSGDRSALARLGNARVRCGACGAVMPAVECQPTPTGMSCPRCDQKWFLVQ